MPSNRLLTVSTLTGAAAAAMGWFLPWPDPNEVALPGRLGATVLCATLGIALGAGATIFSTWKGKLQGGRRASPWGPPDANGNPRGSPAPGSAPSTRQADGSRPAEPSKKTAAPRPRIEPTKSYHISDSTIEKAPDDPLPLAPSSGAGCFLQMEKGPNVRKRFQLEKDKVVLGRSGDCDIVLPADEVAISREHARIVRVQNIFYIEDLKSRNGTQVNNKKIRERVALRHNDLIRICNVVLSFRDASAPESTPQQEMGPIHVDGDGEYGGSGGEDLHIEASLSTSSHIFLKANQRERLRAMIEMSVSLAQTRQLDQLLVKIVDSLFQVFKQATRCFILLRDDEATDESAKEQLLPKLAQARSKDEEASVPYSRSLVRQCFRSAQAILSSDILQEASPEDGEEAEPMARSVLCVPLVSLGEKPIGVIQLDADDPAHKFTESDLGTLVAVSTQISVALENARTTLSANSDEKPTRNRALAREVQQSFLPAKLPEIDGYAFYRFYESAQEIGGDYYDFMPLPDSSKLAVMIADVAGKGTPAALLMAKLSSDAHYCLQSQSDPAAAVQTLNDLVYQHTRRMDRFVTFAMAVLDTTTHRIQLVNAGHPAPFIYRKADGALHRAGGPVGLPLGVTACYQYEQSELELNPGDFMVLFSDGVSEPYDIESGHCSEQALQSALKGGSTPKAFGERVIQSLKQFTRGKPPLDDMTLVCVGRIG